MKIGETVWAQMGTYGWRSAVITKIGRVYVHLEFAEGKRGKREASKIFPRDRRLNGKDKPKPARTMLRLTDDFDAYCRSLL